MSEYVQQRNGYMGEQRSKALIPKGFWVLTRSVDADAADLMVQNGYENAEDLEADRAQALYVASIQAKFFEGVNQVNIDKKYIFNLDGSTRKGFLAFLHTDDDNDEPVYYVFTSQEIIDNWENSKDGMSFYFSLRCDRDYKNFKNIGIKNIHSKLSTAIRQNAHVSMSQVWMNASATYSSVRNPSCIEPKYQLLKIGTAAVALFQGDKNYIGHPLEPRKDIFTHFGTYDWGYGGGGVYLLSVSILTHFLCGRCPDDFERDNLVIYLLSRMDGSKNYIFGKEEIFRALAGFPGLEDHCNIPLAIKIYDEVEKKYSGYFKN